MKLRLSILFLLLNAFNLNAQFDPFPGIWSGDILVQGSKLNLIFKIKKNAIEDPALKYTSKMDVPMQMAKNIEVDETLIKKKNITFNIRILGANFKGKLIDTNHIEGVFYQNKTSFELNLTKTHIESELDRPQTPKAPFKYGIESAVFSNREGDILFSGSLTYPKTLDATKHPVVILFSGSGAQTRDGNIFGHQTYWVIADHLTKAGYAVLRVDDRGAGNTKVKPTKMNYTTADLIEDGLDYVQYIKTLPMIDSNRIFLIGHSEGGAVAAAVAAKNKKIRGIIGLAPSLISGLDINTYQNAQIIDNFKMDSTSKRLYVHLHRMMVNNCALLPNNSGLSAYKTMIDSVYAVWYQMANFQNKKSIKIIGNQLKGKKYKTVNQSLQSVYQPIAYNAWMKYFLQYNPMEDWMNVKCPALILNGSKDLQVPVSLNKVAFEKLSTRKEITFKELNDLNHLFQKCESGLLLEYGQITETVNPEVLIEMSKWLDGHK
jgi:alpha-beta hydrolase superfamily lysophospholipase